MSSIAWNLEAIVLPPTISDNLCYWVKHERLLGLVLDPSSKVDMVITVGFKYSIEWHS
jgi:hypothetical protein